MDYSNLESSSKRRIGELAGNIARSTTIYTLKAIGISTSKTTYSEREVAAFLWARFLFDQGFTAKQVTQAFANKDTHIVISDEERECNLDSFLSCFDNSDSESKTTTIDTPENNHEQ
ncbi:MAG: hypothetical protein AAGA80_06520 [Cyanobacteria bacterium P01_F01_bin.143]